MDKQTAVRLLRRKGFWTHDASGGAGHLYYFAPSERHPGPYRRQIEVRAIIDIADDGTLAGIELIEDMPPPPSARSQSKDTE